MRTRGARVRRTRAGVQAPRGKLTLPERFDSTDGFAAELLRSYAHSLGAPDVFDDPDRGSGVTVGIVDSTLGPPPGTDRYEISVQRDYAETDRRDPRNHGTLVFGALSQFARDATFNFYRLFGEEDECVLGTDVLEPIADAGGDGVDLLNVSAGFPHADDNGSFRVRRAVREETEHGMTIIAATGNVNKDPSETVHCPARYEEAIGVGGFVPACSLDFLRSTPDYRLWVRTRNRRDYPDRQGPLCSWRGCSPDHDCEDHRNEQWWSWNLTTTNGKPDILAPVHYVAEDRNGPYLIRGTSFSTPLVTGLVAVILSDMDGNPDPEQIRWAVREGGAPIGDGNEKFDSAAVRRSLAGSVGSG